MSINRGYILRRKLNKRAGHFKWGDEELSTPSSVGGEVPRATETCWDVMITLRVQKSGFFLLPCLREWQ